MTDLEKYLCPSEVGASTRVLQGISHGLIRVRTLGHPVPESTSKAIKPHADAIHENFNRISSDLQGVNFHRYERNITGGIQEYMEALSFQHYLETQNLITPEQASVKLQSFADEGTKLQVTPSDYVLGLFDMTGELMRFAITTMATVGALPGAALGDTVSAESLKPGEAQWRHVLHDLQELRARLETLDASFYQYEKKLEVTQTSVSKVEKALYGLVVRGSERPKGWMPDVSGSREHADAENAY